MADETYLGDALYASFDGYQIKLRTRRDAANDHVVYLEPAVWHALQQFAANCWPPTPSEDPDK